MPDIGADCHVASDLDRHDAPCGQFGDVAALRVHDKENGASVFMRVLSIFNETSEQFQGFFGIFRVSKDLHKNFRRRQTTFPRRGDFRSGFAAVHDAGDAFFVEAHAWIFVAEAKPFDFGTVIALDEADVDFGGIAIFVEDHGAARQFREEHPTGAFVV